MQTYKLDLTTLITNVDDSVRIDLNSAVNSNLTLSYVKSFDDFEYDAQLHKIRQWLESSDIVYKFHQYYCSNSGNSKLYINPTAISMSCDKNTLLSFLLKFPARVLESVPNDI